jgi:hypothetical protein
MHSEMLSNLLPKGEYAYCLFIHAWIGSFWHSRNDMLTNVSCVSSIIRWNWRNVTMDEEMFICSVSGELLHPVHCRHLAMDEDEDDDDDDEPMLERGAYVIE